MKLKKSCLARSHCYVKGLFNVAVLVAVVILSLQVPCVRCLFVCICECVNSDNTKQLANYTLRMQSFCNS